MASATGIPERHHDIHGRSEEEPLLGGPGDASQEDGQPLWWNLGLGKLTPRAVLRSRHGR